ncbi:MAG: cation:proton antiporter [Ignavibacteriae bacterium]|nr:cation:proton antiporter [Ignavibacteriota bacterium]
MTFLFPNSTGGKLCATRALLILCLIIVVSLFLGHQKGLCADHVTVQDTSIALHSTGNHTDPVTPVLIALSVILLGAKLGGELFERVKLPAVLGELVVGIVFGNLVLITPSWSFFEPLRTATITEQWAVVIDSLARIGVILLLFEVGLESTVGEMRRVGLSSSLVATVGVIVPFALGFGISWIFFKEVPQAILALAPNFDLTNIHIFIGAILCATSVGITARVFKDLGKIHLPEAKIILGAAVIDDVLGLIILAVVSGIVVAAETGASLSIGSLVKIAGIAFGFLAGAIVVGRVVVPRMMSLMAQLRSKGMMIISAILFCFLLSYLANLAGLATIVGAFAAGLILEQVHFQGFKEERQLEELLAPVTTLLVPIFFVMMGIQVKLETFANLDVLGIALGLTFVAFLGKQFCGLAVVEKGLDRLSIGIGMVPRGEVGLIFASIGKNLKVVDDAIFSAIVIMVILTTLVTPPLLKFSLHRYEKQQKSK